METHGSATNEVIRNYWNYERVGEFFIPMKRTIDTNGRQYVFNVESYEVDIEIPKGTFDLPKSIVGELERK